MVHTQMANNCLINIIATAAAAVSIIKKLSWVSAFSIFIAVVFIIEFLEYHSEVYIGWWDLLNFFLKFSLRYTLCVMWEFLQEMQIKFHFIT